MPIMKSNKHQMCYADTFTIAFAPEIQSVHLCVCVYPVLGTFTIHKCTIPCIHIFIYLFIQFFLLVNFDRSNVYDKIEIGMVTR